MNKKLIGEVELSEGVFKNSKYLRAEFDEYNRSIHITLLGDDGEKVASTAIGLDEEHTGELFTSATVFALQSLEQASRIDKLEDELAECRKQLAQKQ